MHVTTIIRESVTGKRCWIQIQCDSCCRKTGEVRGQIVFMRSYPPKWNHYLYLFFLYR